MLQEPHQRGWGPGIVPGHSEATLLGGASLMCGEQHFRCVVEKSYSQDDQLRCGWVGT